jgi:methyl-accepting chemotaxis protein
MGILLELYLQLTVRTRIMLLAVCYSICIVLAVIAGRALSLMLAIASTTLFVVLGVIFCGLLYWAIDSALKRIMDYLSALAEGDLTQTIEARRNNEMSRIIRAVGTLQQSMRTVITNIARSSEQVAQAAGNVRENAGRIAVGTESVAGQAETVATASEEMSATTSDIAHNCMLAAESSNRASQTARENAVVVRDAVMGMERVAVQVKDTARTIELLGQRSDQIGQIVGTIEDIAGQTNLLALNAAIEAARAGEQGRGFAVVADEVRALAERTTRATREIGQMIRAIQQETQGAVAAIECGVVEVEKGLGHSVKSGEALDQILAQVNEVSLQVSQIATAAEEQTATTGEIAVNMQQITGVIQTTASSATETATASTQLAGEAEHLYSLVRQFRI